MSVPLLFTSPHVFGTSVSNCLSAVGPSSRASIMRGRSGGSGFACASVCVVWGGGFEHHVALLHVLLLGLWLICLYWQVWECKLADLLQCEAPSH